MVVRTPTMAQHVAQALRQTRVAVKEHYYAVLYDNDGTTVRVRVRAMPAQARAGDRILDHFAQAIEPLRIVFVRDPWK